MFFMFSFVAAYIFRQGGAEQGCITCAFARWPDWLAGGLGVHLAILGFGRLGFGFAWLRFGFGRLRFGFMSSSVEVGSTSNPTIAGPSSSTCAPRLATRARKG